MNASDITKYLDSYSRVARLYPAFLVSAPFIWTLGTLHPQLLSTQVSNIIATLFTFLGGLSLLSSLARHYGKKAEDKLKNLWGGLRTTVLLRHGDNTIDRYTKLRYHSSLQNICGSTLTIPSPEEENRDPNKADEKYQSAIKKLIELRRDKNKYNLLYKELTYYGFRRNLFGLKKIAIFISILAITINLVAWKQNIPITTVQALNTLISDIMLRWDIYTIFLVNTIYLLLWIFCINSYFVLRSANEYAIELFKTLEEVPHNKA